MQSSALRTLSALSVAFVQRRVPALLNLSEPPETERDRPGRQEHAHDHESEGVDVDILQPTPERPRQIQPRRAQPTELERADDARHGNRQPGDSEVVEDLPDGLGEGPAVDEVHERAID